MDNDAQCLVGDLMEIILDVFVDLREDLRLDMQCFGLRNDSRIALCSRSHENYDIGHERRVHHPRKTVSREDWRDISSVHGAECRRHIIAV